MANTQRLRRAPGLTPEPICLRLADLARRVSADEAIVEIGVYRGRTTSYLAFGARYGQQAHVYGVDVFDLRRLGRHSVPEAEARRTLRQQGMTAYVTLIKGFSADVAATWDGPKIGLLFIDGDHSTAGVRKDVEAWSPHLADDAVIAFDDFGGNPRAGVATAVNEFVESGLLVVEEVVEGRLAIATLAEGHEPDLRTDTEREADEQAAASRGQEIEGEIVETGTMPGEAVNADTEEVTAPGEPLPEIQQVDGEPLPEGRPEPPPRAGAGSGVEAWREYAHQVIEIDGTVLAEMSRAEIIKRLEREGIIGG